MQSTPSILPDLIDAVAATIESHAEEVTQLDQTLGDGDHVTNLRRGLKKLMEQKEALAAAEDWSAAMQKIAMSVMSTVGGASGSLYGTLFMALSKGLKGKPVDLPTFARAFAEAVDAVKKRGRTEVGEKTMVDTLAPVADALLTAADASLPLAQVPRQVRQAAEKGMESTRDMLATKGRASYMGERSRGVIDAGARTSQLMICAIADRLGA